MKLPRPPWEFRDNRDKSAFKAWVIARLKERELAEDQARIDAVTAEDLQRDILLDSDEVYRPIGEELFRKLKRSKVLDAVREKDPDTLIRLTAKDDEMTRLALREIFRKRGRGRKKGEPRAGSWDYMTKEALQIALNELPVIRSIIKQHWNRWKGSDETAIEIAAERTHVTAAQLRKFRMKKLHP